MRKNKRVSAIGFQFVPLMLLSVPAWPNACTLSASTNLSASGGHWTGTGCTGSYIPGNGDTTTIPDGLKLTVDQNWTIGASGANNTTAAIAEALTGYVEVSGGVTLTLRGDLTYQPVWVLESNSAIVMDAGSTLQFDSSQAVSPTTTRYRIGGTNATYGSRFFTANGTAALPVIVTSVNINGALNGQFRHGVNPVGVAFGYGGCNLAVTHTSFSNIGDGGAHGESFAPYEFSGDGGSCSISYSTFNNVGPWAIASLNFSNGEAVAVNNNTWTNSPCAAAALGCFPVSTETGGAYSFQNNVFDFCVGSGGANQTGINWSGSYLGGGTCGAMTTAVTQTNLFNHQVLDPGNKPLKPNGNITGGYYLLDLPSPANPHWVQAQSNTNIAVTGMIFDSPDDYTTDSGEILNYGGAGTYTQALNNALVLPTKTGKGISELASGTSAFPAASTAHINFLHDTWPGESGFGAIQTHEGGSMLYPFTAMESVLTWSTAAGANYCKVNTQTATGMLLQPSITTVDYNSADANVLLNAVSTGCNQTCSNLVCVNQGLGYIGRWSSTPGTHDVSAAPFFADATRNVATWDTKYLRNALGTAWVTGTGYTVGQIVSDSHAGYYGGAPINFRCIANHTSGSTTEPNVGASWRTDWEWASLYDIRTAMTANTAYTDGAIGCPGCTPIQALVAWVQRGFTPQNPALWCAGHDGETIGAVPFCASGRVMIGMLAGM